MKIGVSSYSFQTLLKRGMTYFEACQHARDMGYDGIEFIDLDLAFAPGEDNVESLASICARIAKHWTWIFPPIPWQRTF